MSQKTRCKTKKGFIIILLLVLIVVVNTGCWSRKELNDLSIVTGLGVDKINGEYLVSVQIIRPAAITGKGGAGEAQIDKYEIRGKTVFEALRKMSTQIARRLYLSHLRVLAFSDELAKEGIGPVLDFFSRDHELRSDFNIVIVYNKPAKELLDILTPLEKIPADKINKSITVSERIWGHTILTNIDDLISEMETKGIEPVLPGIVIQGSTEKGKQTKQLQSGEPEALIHLSTLAVLKEDKFIGRLTNKESLGVNIVLDKLKSTIIPIPCNKEKGTKNFITMEIMRSKTKSKAEIIDGEPKINIQIENESNVADVPCDLDLTNNETINELEIKLEKEIKKTVETSIKNVQKKFKADIFGFGEMIHRKDPTLWKELRKDWDKNFATLPVEITVNAKIKRIGTTNNSFLKNMKKSKE